MILPRPGSNHQEETLYTQMTQIFAHRKHLKSASIYKNLWTKVMLKMAAGLQTDCNQPM